MTSAWEKFVSLLDPLKVEEINDGWVSEDLDDDYLDDEEIYDLPSEYSIGFAEGFEEGYRNAPSNAVYDTITILVLVLDNRISQASSKSVRQELKYLRKLCNKALKEMR